MYKKIIICDICHREEDLTNHNPCRKKWFIENISHSICSIKCFNKSKTK